jgi:hypothetical protein
VPIKFRRIWADYRTKAPALAVGITGSHRSPFAGESREHPQTRTDTRPIAYGVNLVNRPVVTKADADGATWKLPYDKVTGRRTTAEQAAATPGGTP